MDRFEQVNREKMHGSFSHCSISFRIGRFRVLTWNAMVGRINHHGSGRVVQFCSVWLRSSVGSDAPRRSVRLSEVEMSSIAPALLDRLCDERPSALMAVYFLDEKLNRLGKIGCLLTICGSIVIIIHAPKESEVNSLSDFARKIGAPGIFLIWRQSGIPRNCLFA